MTDVLTLADLAARLKMSPSWTQKHWREMPGLPAPFIGADKGQHPRWRAAEIAAFLASSANASTTINPTQPDSPPVIASHDDDRFGSLLRLAG